MTSVYKNKYVSDIPLKRPQETFVDEPDSLDEVSLHDLEFDLANGIKNIGNLHAFHAVAVFKTLLEDLIFLGANKDALCRFRRQQLGLYSLDLDVLHAASLGSPVSISPVTGNLNPDSPPDSDQGEDDESTEMRSSSLEEQSGFISTESLVQTTSLDSPQDIITCHNIERLRQEVLFHMAPKVQQQAGHLLRCFSLAKAPPITIEQFLVRIKTYLPSISVSVYIHSAYMIYKLCVLLDVVELTPLNVYRFILALLRCLTKKLEDVYQKQKSFATVGGVALKELCKIEVSFLYLFNFKMVVSEYILNHFLATDFIALREFCNDLRTQEKTLV